MPKTTSPMTPEQKALYWKKQFFTKYTSFAREFNLKISPLFSMAKYMGLKEDRLKSYQERLAALFTELSEEVQAIESIDQTEEALNENE